MTILRKVIQLVNTLLFCFSAVLVGLSAAAFYNYDSSINAFFSRADFGWFIVAGLIGMVLSVTSCLGTLNPMEHYGFLFTYFILLTLLIALLSTGFYFYRVLVNNLQATASGSVTAAVNLAASQEFNDFLLSVFVTCCTGCIQSIQPACVEEIDTPNSFVSVNGTATVSETDFNCDPDKIALDGNTSAPGNSQCFIPSVCSSADINDNNGLDKGCVINAIVLPPYLIDFQSVCLFFDEFATDDTEVPIVGPVGDGSCGNGSPRVFVQKVEQFMSKNYTVLITFWAFMLAVAGIAWLGSFIILLCPLTCHPHIGHAI